MQVAGLKGARLSSQQARLWSLQSEQHAYQTIYAVRMEGELNESRLHQTLELMVDQYEILRTVFYTMPDMDVPLQVVLESKDNPTRMIWSYLSINLLHLDTARQRTAVDEFIEKLQQTPYDLTRSPLLRIWLLQQSTHLHTLLLQMPALCADAFTPRIFVEELFRSYAASQESSEDTEDPLQYADVSAWQDELLLEDDAIPGQEYWQKTMLAQPDIVHIPLQGEEQTS